MPHPPTPAGAGSRPLLGRGLTADVYAFDGGRALKLFHGWVEADAVRRELELTRAVHAAGAPAPAVFELVTLNGRHGIVLERVEGHSMVREAELRPWRLLAVARELADLHASLHALPAPPALPSQREQLARWIAGAALGGPEEAELRRLLDEAPSGTRLCHGDFHPGNVLLSPRGPVVIDWSRATAGDPALDVARTSVLITDARIPDETAWHVRALVTVSRGLLHETYIRRYAARARVHALDVTRWRRLQRVAALYWRAQERRRGGQAPPVIR